MIKTTLGLLLAGCLLASCADQPQAALAPPPTVELGTCPLVGGSVLEPCRLSFRIYGRLNAARDNAVLLPTWFRGSSGDWRELLGPSGLVDTTRFAAIAIDAFGAGRSSAPSDTGAPASPFPALTIRDMVNAQYRLLRDTLGVSHLAAVVGYSMGGMQALEWGVAYPTFVDRLVVIEGSPRLAAPDTILWQSVLRTLESEHHGVSRDSVAARTARVLRFAYSTEDSTIGAPPEKVARQLGEAARTIDEHMTFDDMAVQVRAMLSQDVASNFGGDMHLAATASRPRLLVVASPEDRAVSQQPTLTYAADARGDSLVVRSPCGHRVLFCERTAIGRTTQEFLVH